MDTGSGFMVKIVCSSYNLYLINTGLVSDFVYLYGMERFKYKRNISKKGKILRVEKYHERKSERMQLVCLNKYPSDIFHKNSLLFHWY